MSEQFRQTIENLVGVYCETDDGVGITLVHPRAIELEDDGSVSIKIKAWPTNTPEETVRQLYSRIKELEEAAQEVLRISDRKHDAWNRLKAVIRAEKGE